MSTKTRLIDTLTAAGKPTRQYHSPDGTTVLVLPYGGRVLGLFAPGSDENFYWTHAALESAESAARYYRGPQWHNSGGDRTWLAPEVDFFFPNFPQTDVYFQPRGLDPGNYQVLQDATGERLVNRGLFVLARSQAEVEVEITKSLAPAPNPLRYERAAAHPSLAYAGYTLRTTLRFLARDDAPGATIGLWNLIQMPDGGELLVPTHGRAEAKVIFGTIPPDDLCHGAHLFRYRMRAVGEQKLGLRAVAVTGRIGYLYPAADGHWSLLIRNLFVDPSGEYVDVPWGDTRDLGYAVQACHIDNPDLGQFSELEYHSPAIGAGTGRQSCEDISQVWAFRGGRDAIEWVIQSLLTAER